MMYVNHFFEIIYEFYNNKYCKIIIYSLTVNSFSIYLSIRTIY